MNVQKHISWWYTHVPNIVCLHVCQRAKTTMPSTYSMWKCYFDVEAKGKGHTRSWMWHRFPWWFFCAIDMIRNISGIFWKDGGVPVGAKYGLTISKSKKSVARTQSHVKNPINLTLRSNVNVVSGSWMYATLPLMVKTHVPNIIF